MNTPTPSSYNIAELMIGVRPERSNERLRESRQGGAGADEFLKVLSKLNGEGAGSSEETDHSRSAADFQFAKDEREERSSKMEPVSNEASAPPELAMISCAMAIRTSIDPNWPRLLEHAPESVADNVRSSDLQGSNAKQLPTDRPVEAAPLAQYERSVTTQGVIEASQPEASEQTTTSIARPAMNGASTFAATPIERRQRSSRLESTKGDESHDSDCVKSAETFRPNMPPIRSSSPEPKSDAEALHSAAAPIATNDPRPSIGPPPRDRDDSVVEPSVSSSPVQASALATEPERDDDEGGANTIRRIKIQSLETHLPVALSNMLVAQAGQSFDLDEKSEHVVNVDIAHVSTIVHSPRSSVGAAKTLTIELEPAALGAIIVKMKRSGSSIDMHIRVESIDALRALDATREKLIDTMQSAGCTVDACTIQVGATPNAASLQPMTHADGQGQGSTAFGDGRQEHVGSEGRSHGGRSGDPRDGAERGAEEISRDVAPRRAIDRNGGVYL